MARMSVDDKVFRDPRITALAKVLNWNRRETLGCLISEVWAICYDQETHLISAHMIDLAANHVGFAKAMVECELAKPDRSGKLQIAGARERIEYLDHKKRAGRQGGINSAESRVKGAKQKSPGAQAAGNPPVPDPVPDPSPVPVPDPVPSPAPVPVVVGDSGAGPANNTANRRRAQAIPEHWEPHDEERRWCQQNGLDCDAEAVQFKDHHTARGTTFKDWRAGFRTWIRNAKKWGRQRVDPGSGFQAVMAIARGEE